jgi:hypothetical protein
MMSRKAALLPTVRCSIPQMLHVCFVLGGVCCADAVLVLIDVG